MEKNLAKTRKSWQDLANELRNQIKTKEGASDEAHELQMEQLKKTFKAVASVFLFQRDKFRKLAKSIPEGEGRLKEELAKAARKSKKATKMMKKKLEFEIAKVTKKP